MIVFKIIICICIILVCGYLGIEKSNSYNKRVLELNKIKNGFNFFKSKIEFTYEPIKEILDEITKSVYDEEENVFGKAKEYMREDSISIAWNKAIEEENKITKEDKDFLKMFGKLLGKTDKNGQISEIDLSLNFVDSQIQKAELEKNKNAKLYKSLGLIVGIGIVVILW